MNENLLVSLVTPVYNGSKHIMYLLDSVLEQSYSNIEHIIVDDGSTDETRKIVKSYIPKYQAAGKLLNYYYISNSGQAAAINYGLKKINGKFLSWPDSDDYYSSNDSIFKMASVLSDSQYQIVRTNGVYVKEDRKTIVKLFSDKSKNPFKEDLFEDCLMKREFWFSGGSALVKTDALKHVVNNFQIINSRVGQNYQLFLPLFYSFKCKYLDEKLFNIVVREGSHSRKKLNFEKAKQNLLEKEHLIEKVLRNIEMPKNEREKYINNIKCRYIEEISRLARRNKKLINFMTLKIRKYKNCK